MHRAATALAALLLAGAAPGDKMIADLDLSEPFGLPAGWRLVATQGPDVVDPMGMPGDKAPAAVSLCLRNPAGRCDPALDARLRSPVVADDAFTEPHFLNRALIVYPFGAGGPPLLVVQAASLHSEDGDQVVVIQVLTRRAGGVARVYRQATGHNNNQEVRYVAAGPLRGAVIAAEPTSDAPYGYWIAVNQPTPALAYRQTARFRSSTRYGDGNPLAVIDSEMPNIQRRLGLWRPGQPLPVPANCAHPHLKGGVLWCN